MTNVCELCPRQISRSSDHVKRPSAFSLQP